MRVQKLTNQIRFFTSRTLNVSSCERERLVKNSCFIGIATERKDIASLIRLLRPVKSKDLPLIRLGPSGDGGYLIPDDLGGISGCFSPGVSDVSGFEYDCAKLGIPVFLADASVNAPALMHERFDFVQNFVGASNYDSTMTVDDWVKEKAGELTGDFLLQMDIEGAEYETILAIPDTTLSRFRTIIIEFHELDYLWCEPFFKVISATFRKLLSSHACVHIHPNNCSKPIERRGISIPPVCEFTFHRRDRMHDTIPCDILPHPLDSDNTSNAHIKLHEQWYRNLDI